MANLIALPKSIIPACDVDSLPKLAEIVGGTHDVPGIGAYKIGLELGLAHGLPQVVTLIRGLLNNPPPIIYDHQKGGTDIPSLGRNFAHVLAKARVDAAILFPFGGDATEL